MLFGSRFLDVCQGHVFGMGVFREHIIDSVDQACPENHLELVACDEGALAQVDVVKLFHVSFVVVLQDNAQTGCTVSGSAMLSMPPTAFTISSEIF